MEEQYETIKWTCPPVTKGPFFFFFFSVTNILSSGMYAIMVYVKIHQIKKNICIRIFFKVYLKFYDLKRQRKRKA